MKLKYKKIILLTTMSIMGIGLLTLSVSKDESQAKEKTDQVQETMATTIEDEAVVSVAPTITVAPTEAPLPVYDIEKDTNSDIKKLFKKFYNAKNDRDVDTIKKLLSDPTKVESQDDLQKKIEYIEEYQNITTYAKKGFEEGTYIVYVYHEIKFTGISTPAPGLSKFYVITDSDGNLKIFSDTMDVETQKYYDDRNEDKDVVDIIDMTNKQSKEAVKSDEDLQSFWDNISALADKESDNAQGDTTE